MRLSNVAGLALGAAMSGGVLAQGAWPAKPIRYIVPFAPAGTGDVCARYHAQRLSERLGQAVVVDNRAGANQAIGLEAAAKSAPDGHTLVQGALSGIVLNTIFVSQSGEKLPYDAIRDLAPVSMVCVSPLYMTVHSSVPARSIKELVEYAKANPGKINYSSNGVGGTQHLGVELFAHRMGLKMVHVPYKSGAQSTQDVVSGVVNMMFGGALMLPQAKAGKVRILASGGMQRTKATPDVPTMNEAGVSGFDVSSWFSLMVPAGTPRPIVDRLHRETDAILKSAAASGSNDIEYQPSTPEELGARIKNDLQVWTKVIKETGIKP